MKPIVLFDLDDTLYSERDYLHSGWSAVAAEAERRGMLNADDAYSLMKSAPDAFDALHATCPDFAISDMVELYREHIPDIRLSNDTRNLLQRLRNNGINTGIITDGRSKGQRNKIKVLGLEKLVDYISISEEINADKHSDKPFTEAMRHFGEEYAYIYVGDNPAKDFLQPNSLGWSTVMLREKAEGINIHSQELKGLPSVSRPDLIIEDLSDLDSLISKIS